MLSLERTVYFSALKPNCYIVVHVNANHLKHPSGLVIGVILPNVEGLHIEENGSAEDFDMSYQANLFSLPATIHIVIVCRPMIFTSDA